VGGVIMEGWVEVWVLEWACIWLNGTVCEPNLGFSTMFSKSWGGGGVEDHDWSEQVYV
jgi:hypothetical protein